MWLAILSDQLPVEALVGRYPANELIGREPLRLRVAAFLRWGCPQQSACGITRPLGRLSPTSGQVAHVLRTRSPVAWPKPGPRDLHVLSTPPAFVLSQDQTLQRESLLAHLEQLPHAVAYDSVSGSLEKFRVRTLPDALNRRRIIESASHISIQTRLSNSL